MASKGPLVGQMARGEDRLGMPDLNPPVTVLPSATSLSPPLPPEHSLNAIIEFSLSLSFHAPLFLPYVPFLLDFSFRIIFTMNFGTETCAISSRFLFSLFYAPYAPM